MSIFYGCRVKITFTRINKNKEINGLGVVAPEDEKNTKYGERPVARFMSSAIKQLSHFPSELFPVSKPFQSRGGLQAERERVRGRWGDKNSNSPRTTIKSQKKTRFLSLSPVK